MVWRRNIIRTFWKLKVEKHRLGSVYFSSEVSRLDSASGTMYWGKLRKEQYLFFFIFLKFSWPKMLIGGWGGRGGGVVISYAQSKLLVCFKYCVFAIYTRYRIHRNHPVTLLPLVHLKYQLVCSHAIFNEVVLYGLRIRFDCKWLPLLVAMWRYGGHASSQEQKHFSP